jgi:hypothetical protein
MTRPGFESGPLRWEDGDYFFYYNLVYEAIGTAATPGLLCQPRVILKMTVEKQMKCRLAGETEVLGENLPQRHFYPSYCSHLLALLNIRYVFRKDQPLRDSTMWHYEKIRKYWH